MHKEFAMNTEISIWDNDTERIRIIEANLYRAMRSLGLKGVVKIISEPPRGKSARQGPRAGNHGQILEPLPADRHHRRSVS